MSSTLYDRNSWTNVAYCYYLLNVQLHSLVRKQRLAENISWNSVWCGTSLWRMRSNERKIFYVFKMGVTMSGWVLGATPNKI